MLSGSASPCMITSTWTAKSAAAWAASRGLDQGTKGVSAQLAKRKGLRAKLAALFQAVAPNNTSCRLMWPRLYLVHKPSAHYCGHPLPPQQHPDCKPGEKQGALLQSLYPRSAGTAQCPPTSGSALLSSLHVQQQLVLLCLQSPAPVCPGPGPDGPKCAPAWVACCRATEDVARARMIKNPFTSRQCL